MISVFRLVLPLLLSTAFAAAGVAVDKNENCASWAELGECENNAAFMKKNCATTCARVEEQLKEEEETLKHFDDFFHFSAADIEGKMIDFEDFRGDVVVVVNVASECGYTQSHYAGLVELYDTFEDEDFHILAFPCNQFGGQEPGSGGQIHSFARSKGVKFTMMSKVDVNGPEASLIYMWLKREAGIKNISWNFGTYFVIGRDGKVSGHSGVEPIALKPMIEAKLKEEVKEEL